MKMFLFSAAAMLMLSGAAMAAVDANAPTPTGVVDTCSLVASTQSTGTNENSGKCIGATGSYLTTLAASAASDDALIDLIGKLAPLASADATCNAFDDEVAQAIALAADKLSDATKKSQALEISATVKACQSGDTAELPGGPVGPNVPNTPAIVNGPFNPQTGNGNGNGGSGGVLPPTTPPVNPSKIKV